MKLLDRLKNIRLSQLLPWLIIIALLILLNRCGGERDGYQRDKLAADSLNRAQSAEITRRKAWELRYHEQAARQQDIAQQAAKKADSITRVARLQTAEIRQLYALLGQPIPHDTVQIASRCCEVAKELADNYDALQQADSIKDHAYLEQIDLAVVRGDSLVNMLQSADRRYKTLDSLRRIAFKASKPRAKISAGVAGGFAPGFGWGGVVLMYSGPGGTHYGVEAGPSSLGGMYYGGRILRTISLRKKR